MLLHETQEDWNNDTEHCDRVETLPLMESEDIKQLREWAPLTDLLQKIPAKTQKGFFFQELNVTSVDALPEFIALGTDIGIVYWYNRKNGDVQKLRTESGSLITCIKIVSSVEHMVAVGNDAGEVNIFQIPKPVPPDLLPSEIPLSLLKPKPIERYTIRDISRGPITCVEWSKNGMRLFSGDAHGLVVLTEIDFTEHICKSLEILNEAYDIVQMSFCSPWLLVSTTYRAIICVKDTNSTIDGKWKVSQIGKTDRKVLNNFGVTFVRNNQRQPLIVCSRPGFRFWLADTEGNVSHTFLLKDKVMEPTFEVPLLNPVSRRPVNIKETHFGPCYYYNNAFIVTYCHSMIFIIDLDKLEVVATIKRLRRIQYLAISGSEIFVLEGGRSLVRLALAPEPTPIRSEHNSLWTSTLPPGTQQSMYTSQFHHARPIESESDDEIVTDADECIELPPIENIKLDVPLRCSLSEHNLLREDKLLLEHSRKLEVFERINRLDYDDSILFNSETKKKKKALAVSPAKADGIVEIGRQAIAVVGEMHEQNKVEDANSEKPNIDQINAEIDENCTEALTTKPCYLEASYCEGIITSQSSAVLTGDELSSREDRLTSNRLSTKRIAPKQLMSTSLILNPPPHFNYPNRYPISSGDYDTFDTLSASTDPPPIFEHTQTNESTSIVDTSARKMKMLNFMKIPSLWDVKIEGCDDAINGTHINNDNGTETDAEGSESEWEFL